MLQNWMKDIRKRMVLKAKLYLGNKIEYHNQIIFQDAEVNLIYYTEKEVQAAGMNRQKRTIT